MRACVCFFNIEYLGFPDKYFVEPKRSRRVRAAALDSSVFYFCYSEKHDTRHDRQQAECFIVFFANFNARTIIFIYYILQPTVGRDYCTRTV